MKAMNRLRTDLKRANSNFYGSHRLNRVLSQIDMHNTVGHTLPHSSISLIKGNIKKEDISKFYSQFENINLEGLI